MCGWSGEASETIAPAANPARGFTAVVARRGDHVVLSDSDGRIVTEKKAGEQDARLIQQAAEMCRSGGELRIMAGQYDLEKSIVLDFPCTVSGEGRGTVLVPPANDYAIRIMKTDRSPTINDWVWGPERESIPQDLINVCGERLYGVYVRSLAIVGNGRGKGIYLTGVTECICDDLAIHSTCDGAAIYADKTVMETEFRSIVCYVNGSIKNREATIVVASQDRRRWQQQPAVYSRARAASELYRRTDRDGQDLLSTADLFHAIILSWLAPLRAHGAVRSLPRACGRFRTWHRHLSEPFHQHRREECHVARREGRR